MTRPRTAKSVLVTRPLRRRQSLSSRVGTAQGEMGRKVAINGEAISGSSTCNLLDSFGYTPGIGECLRSQAQHIAARSAHPK